MFELENVLQREANEGGAELLLPIALDDYLHREWTLNNPQLRVQLRSRVIGDFIGAGQDQALFDASFHRLLKALTSEASAAQRPATGDAPQASRP